jgi:hypothetical protein
MIENIKHSFEHHPDADTQKVGGRALVAAMEVHPYYEPPALEGFNYLLPLASYDPNHPITAEKLLEMAHTPEEAVRLALSLPDSNPYREYALGYIAEYYVNNGRLDEAYSIISGLGESAFTVQALSKLVIYLDDHNIQPFKPGLNEELHNRAIATYLNHPSAETARALGEASEALPDDKEMRDYARAVINQHQEIQPYSIDPTINLY